MATDLQKIKLFISYSHDDEAYFKVFNEGIKKVVKNAEPFEWNIWNDKDIHVGSFWDEEIQNNIKDCNVAMLLVSVGFMGSTYIKEIEYNEFINRYNAKGILIVPIVFAPCDFNRWEDLAKIQFFKPKGSEYGKPEIENFTYSDLIEFKKTDGILIPNPNINRYHLDLVKKIEQSFKEFLNRKMQEEEKAIQIPLNANVNKLADFPKPSNLFTGRKKEVNEFQQALNSYRIFTIEGLGGTGKTQFAAKCIEDSLNDKNKIIWLNGSSQSNFDVFVENAGYGDVLKGEKKTDLALYSGLKDLIEKDERIIFWDNYNDYNDASFSNFLSFANQYLQKATIILITKVDPTIEGITSLPIVRLEGLEDDAIEYAKKLKASNTKYKSISDSDLLKICDGVEGHPLAIEFSMLLMGYGKSADEIMLHMPEYYGIKKVEDFSKRLFFDILYHSNTISEERECFLRCSVFKERIDEDGIKSVNDGKEVFTLLAGLIDKLLITSKDGFYEMHPLVRSFSYEKLTDKKYIHKKAANYFITLRSETLNYSLEEKIFYHLSEAEEWSIIADFIEATGRKFIHQGQLGLIKEFMNILVNSNVSRPIFEILYGDIAQIKGEWNKAIVHFEKASEEIQDKSVKAEGMIKYGEILFRRGDIQESLPFFEVALSFAKDQSFRKHEARALNDIGLVYFNSNQLDLAYEKISAALKIRKEIEDIEGVATSYNNMGSIFISKKRYSKACENFEKSISIAEEIGNKTELSLYFRNIGNVYQLQNKLHEALLKFNEALSIDEENADICGIGHCLNAIGAIFLTQGKFKEAINKLNDGLKLFEEVGDKRGIASSYNNIGSFYIESKNYHLALSYFFKSFDLNIKTGNKLDQANVINWINSISTEIGKTEFNALANQVYNELDSDIQGNIQLSYFINEPEKSEFPKVNRNDLCPCGSGKKYKYCHGAPS